MVDTRKADFSHLMNSVQHYAEYTQSVTARFHAHKGNVTEYAQATISPDIETGFYDTFEEKSDHDLDEATAKRNMRWQEMSQVKESDILGDMSDQEKKLQEALFEIISSELSYKKSLKVLVDTEMDEVESKFSIKKGTREHTHLFSNIRKVYDVCVKLCNLWETVWCENIELDKNHVCKGLADFFEVEENKMTYILYYRNVVYQQRMVEKLSQRDEAFKRYSKVGCDNMALYDSFLALPFQRIPRYRILLEAVIKQLPGEDMSDPEYQPIQQSLDSMLTFVAQCNNAVKKMEDLEYMIDLQARLDFEQIKTVALISEQREALRHNEMKRVIKSPSMIQKYWTGTEHEVEMHLFSDLLLMCQVKKGNMLAVKGYCTPTQVCAEVIEQEKAEELVKFKLPAGCDNLLKISFFPTGESRVGFKEDCYLLACPTSDIQIKWIQSLTPQLGIKDTKFSQLSTFDKATAPIVQVVYAYVANHADELTIFPGEVLRVLKKINNSDWWEGEKLSSNEYGWFPGNYTVEITDPRKRMAILLQQNKVLQMTTHFQTRHPNLKENLFSLKDIKSLG